MQMLKDAILEKGRAINQDVLLVDSFLNHQVDVGLMKAVGEAFAEHFSGKRFTRVVTIESSGIAPAAFTALSLNLPLVIMKKQTSRILTGDILQTTVRSFTKGTSYELTVKRDFLEPGDRVLLIDDFLASGEAAFGVLHLAQQAGATVDGIGASSPCPNGISSSWIDETSAGIASGAFSAPGEDRVRQFRRFRQISDYRVQTGEEYVIMI